MWIPTPFIPNTRRSEAFAEAMRRAEEAADPKPPPFEYVGRDGLGRIHTIHGTIFTPGPHFNRDVFEALPTIGGNSEQH
jgi:hypothetical protein